jgi:hypothetical protein
VVSRILAFRPASVVDRLGPRNDACPLSLRDLLGPAAELGIVLPVVRAPIVGVARAALVAAKELGSAVGLALPTGVLPEAWFAAVTRAADEVAVGLPIFLSAEVTVEGDAALQVERAAHEAWRLVDAGLTHLAFDVTAVPPGERGRVLADVAAAGVERGICVDVTLSLEDGARAVRDAGALVEDLAGRGVVPDVATVRCPATPDPGAARAQVAALARLCAALGGVPLLRRGPVTQPLLALLPGSPVQACDDGFAAAAAALGLIPWDLIAPDEGESRVTAAERGAAELSDEGADRLEARAYVEVVGVLDGLGAAGSAHRLARALERRLEDG